MPSLHNKIAVVTGATAGIGRACAEQLAAEGVHLIITGRREDRLTAFAGELQQAHPINVLPLVFDVRDYSQVKRIFATLPSEWQAVEILINNAGLGLGLEKIQQGDVNDWEVMIDTNIKGLLYVTQQVLPLMLARNAGHIVNLASIASYHVYPGGAVYCATKFAVRALTQGIKLDVHGSDIRVSEIAPGMVETEFSEVRFKGDVQRAAQVYAGMTPLTANDIADTVLFCLTRPRHVNILSIHVNPTDQSSPGLVHRRGV
ncbi:MAG: NAD(P)-dependent oxidoreductase [Coxiella sp. RIFCSPHIGHO2_12_FULL_42_15]|nr:MAG: NAD(P)-dependent oxidoreductase [Coxiella sp. RIFCSPHIGHO2_12_FULL_42_15]